jgi:Reverse transcriptase (RNA-dependent DNA polymerase)
VSEIPVHFRPRRLADWLNPTGARKVHSLIDKVYQRKNLELAWERVRANRGSGGVDGQSLDAYGAQLDEQLERLQRELTEDAYQPQPVRQAPIPKVGGKPGEQRMLGVPTVRDRVCQQALLNRLEPIFEPVFDDANFGYRRGRSTIANLRLLYSIARVTEPGSSIVGGNGLESCGDGLLQSFSGAGLGRPQELFKLGPGLLDGVEVGRVGWQIEKVRPAGGEQLLDTGYLVGRQIVQHDDVAGLELWTQHLCHISPQHLAVGGCGKGQRRLDSAQAHGPDGGQHLPLTLRRGFDDAHTLGRASP